MQFAVAWLLGPLVWAGLSFGLGAGLRGLSSERLAWPLAIPSGFAVLVVLMNLLTAWPPVAGLAVPTVLVLAGLGWYTQRMHVRPTRAALGPLLAGAAVYLLYLAPVMVSGAPFVGWIKLDDGATWLAFADRLIEAGRTTAGLSPSSYEAVLQINWESSAYPVGAFPPLGAVAALLNIDPAWLLQPYLAFLAATLALVVWAVLTPHVVSPRWRVALVLLATTPALLLGYAWWGGIKEIALAPLVLALSLLAADRTPAIVIAVSTAAILAIAGFSGGAWAALPIAFWLVVATPERRWVSIGAFVGLTALLSLPLLGLVRPRNVAEILSFAADDSDIGNLRGPLDRWQVVGIWPVGDFRDRPEPVAFVYFLLGVVVLLAAIGVIGALSRRLWAVPLYGATVLLVAMASTFGNPWIGGKALAIASPAVLIAAATGIGWLRDQQWGIAARTGIALVGVGIGWSYMLAYQSVWLAPREQLLELSAIGADRQNPSPALMLEYSPYGVRHFLRDLSAEGAGELRRRTVSLVDGGTLPKAAYADLDEIAQSALADYPTLVLRRSATASRPPSNYTLAWSGRFYEVWRRDPDARAVVRHIPLGSQVEPAEVPACEFVRQAADEAGASGVLATVVRDPVVVVPFGSQAAVPTDEPVSLEQMFSVPTAGSYALSLGGSVPGTATVKVDGREVGTIRQQLNWTGNTTPVAQLDLAAGQHRLRVDYTRPRLQPGGGAQGWSFGPMYVGTSARAVTVVPAADYRQLCGRHLDWLEVLR